MQFKTFGTDSEFFVYDKDDNFVPAYRITKGNKDEHEPIAETSYGEVCVHWDNVALEVTCPPVPLKSVIHYKHDITEYLSAIKYELESWLSKKDMKLSHSPVIHIDKSVMFDQEANIFGCEPDFNAYTLSRNESPSPMKAKTLRTAGAHFHFGLEVINDYTVINSIRSLDYEAFALLNMLSAKNRELELERRKLYGKAGAYRLKPYGFEYRTFSPLVFSKLGIMSGRIAARLHSLNTLIHKRSFIETENLPEQVNSGVMDEGAKHFDGFLADLAHLSQLMPTGTGE